MLFAHRLTAKPFSLENYYAETKSKSAEVTKYRSIKYKIQASTFTFNNKTMYSNRFDASTGTAFGAFTAARHGKALKKCLSN